MGVKNLWTALDQIKQSKSLLVSSAERRLSDGLGHAYMIGVDMGTFMAECNAIALAAGVNTQQAGGGLNHFFKRLSYFLQIDAVFVFVLDGLARPRVKRGRVVRRQPIWWTNLAIELIEHFGYIFRQAPGEAEAELAMLNAAGNIHAVLTSDSDAIVFGAKYLLRSIPKRDRRFPDEHMLYDVRAPGSTSGGTNGFLITQANLVLLALFCGGDYDDGLLGCGHFTAKALAQCGFGDQLLTAYRNLRGSDYEEFMFQWRAAIRVELSTNSQGHLPAAKPNLAASLRDDFPRRRVVGLYIDPITSSTPGFENDSPEQWGYSQPFIPALTEFCMRHFNWDRQAIKREFSTHLWPGIFANMMYSPVVIYSDGRYRHGRLQFPNYFGAEVLRVSYQPRRGKYALMFGSDAKPQLVVCVKEFIDEMGPAFHGEYSDRVSVWLPAHLYSILRPNYPQPQTNPGIATVPPPPQPNTLLSAPSTSGAESSYVGAQDHRWIQTGVNRWFIDLSED